MMMMMMMMEGCRSREDEFLDGNIPGVRSAVEGNFDIVLDFFS
jgi:hypothetical protein